MFKGVRAGWLTRTRMDVRGESTYMPFKFNADGSIATQEVNGQKLPVFVHPDGKELPFDGDGTLSTISRLNGEAKGHRERAETAEGKLKAFDGISDPAAAIKALSTVKNLDDKKLVDAGEIEKVKSEVSKALEQQYAPYKTKAETMESQLNNLLIGSVFKGSKFVATKFAAADAAAASEIAGALFGNRFKVEDGKVVGYDAQGNKLYSRARPGELADPDEAIELIVDAYPHKASILKGSGASGSGAAGSNPGAGGKKSYTRAQFDALDPTAQAAAAREANEGKAVITD